MKIGVSRFVILATPLLLAATAASAQVGQFRITNAKQGTGFSLDVGNLVNNGQTNGMLAPTSQASGQFWKMTYPFILNNRMKLSNTFTGDDMCLDVNQDGSLFMDKCSSAVGQRWEMQEVPGVGVRFGNEFAPGYCLDYSVTTISTNIGLPLLVPCNNTPSQVWVVSHTGRF